MKWIPSFSKLLLLGSVSFILYMGVTVYLVKTATNVQQPGLYQVAGVVRLIGLALTVVAPFLMLLKFFQRPDQQP